MPNQPEAETKPVTGLLGFIILQSLDTRPMHGKQIVANICRSFGICLGVSTIYLLLSALEAKGYVTSGHNNDTSNPRGIYELTREGKNLLNLTEHLLNSACRKMSAQSSSRRKN